VNKITKKEEKEGEKEKDTILYLHGKAFVFFVFLFSTSFFCSFFFVENKRMRKKKPKK